MCRPTLRSSKSTWGAEMLTVENLTLHYGAAQALLLQIFDVCPPDLAAAARRRMANLLLI